MLHCADGAIYTGITTDLPTRLAKHQAGTGARYTRSRLPVEVVWTLQGVSARQARVTERRLKRFKRAEKLMLIMGEPTLAARIQEWIGQERI
jgi:predicted GIY-YIG superfamily endonuclease